MFYDIPDILIPDIPHILNIPRNLNILRIPYILHRSKNRNPDSSVSGKKISADREEAHPEG